MGRAAWAAVMVAGVALAAVVIVLDPTVDQVVLWLIYGAAFPATLFTILHGFTVPWWQTMIGRALLVSSGSLALLLDLSLFYQWFGPNYLGRDVIRVILMALIFAGAWLKLGALLEAKWADHKDRGGDRVR